jgi:hypothetical protein
MLFRDFFMFSEALINFYPGYLKNLRHARILILKVDMKYKMFYQNNQYMNAFIR